MPTGRDGYQPGFRTEARESGLVAVVGRGGGIELPGVVRLIGPA